MACMANTLGCGLVPLAQVTSCSHKQRHRHRHRPCHAEVTMSPLGRQQIFVVVPAFFYRRAGLPVPHLRLLAPSPPCCVPAVPCCCWQPQRTPLGFTSTYVMFERKRIPEEKKKCAGVYTSVTSTYVMLERKRIPDQKRKKLC